MIDAQSQEVDPKKRLTLVQPPEEAGGGRRAAVDRLAARYFPTWEHVKNLVPHQSIYNLGRMQEVWRDK